MLLLKPCCKFRKEPIQVNPAPFILFTFDEKKIM